jgi:chemoreceptor-like protein with four helix bundle sensory module
MKESAFQRTALGTFAVVLLLVIATSPFTTVLLVKRQASRIVYETLPGLTTSGLAEISISEGFLDTSLAFAATNEADRQRFLARMAERSRNADVQLQTYEAAISNPADRENYDRLRQRRSEWRQTRQKMMELLGQGNREQALRLYNTEGLIQSQAYLEALDRIFQYNVNEARMRGAQILRLCNIFMIVQAVLLCFFFVYAFYVPLIALLERLTGTHVEPDI